MEIVSSITELSSWVVILGLDNIESVVVAESPLIPSVNLMKTLNDIESSNVASSFIISLNAAVEIKSSI